jgi:ABC-type transport system involved in cytochrome c biogenesis ATPase subunit
MPVHAHRRHFITHVAALMSSSTLLPNLLWAQLQENDSAVATPSMVKQAAAIAGLSITDEDAQRLVAGVNRYLARYAVLRQVKLDPHLAPPFYFSPIVVLGEQGAST